MKETKDKQKNYKKKHTKNSNKPNSTLSKTPSLFIILSKSGAGNSHKGLTHCRYRYSAHCSFHVLKRERQPRAGAKLSRFTQMQDVKGLKAE